MERTQHNSSVIDAAKEVSALRDQRYGAQVRCENCLHAFPFRPPGALKPMLECRAAPPLFQFVPQQGPQGMGLTSMPVPRLVAPDYFCGAFLITPEALKSPSV